MTLGALILAGGASSRMGVDKGGLDWGGVRAVDLLVALAGEVGASNIYVVGGGDYGAASLRDEPPGGGPVAGLVAGCRALAHLACDRALVLAVDAPTILASDLQPLLAAPGPGAAFADLHLPLVVRFEAIPEAAGSGWSMKRLIAEAGLRRLEASPEQRLRLRGANTPAEREALLVELAARQVARKDGAA